MAVADVRAILFDVAPEFETVDVGELARVDRFIGYAADDIDHAAYTDAETDAGITADAWYNKANAFLAAHMLTVKGRSGANVGAVTQEKVGDVSTSYADAGRQASQDALASTAYGVEYQRVRSNVFFGAYVPDSNV